MNNQLKYYQESGKYHAPSLLLSVLAVVFLSLVLGYVYSAINYISPIIYINVLLVIGLGIVMGYTVLVLCKLSKVSNYKIRMGLAIFMGLLTLYFQWTAYLGFLVFDGLPDISWYLGSLGWLFYNSLEKELFFELYQYGAYEVFRTQVTDYALLFIWLIEAGIIIATPILAVLRYVPLPISNQYNKFYDQYTLHKDFRSIGSGDLAAAQIQSNPLEVLRDFEKGKANRHSKFKIYYLPEENKQYLKAENVSVQPRNESKTEIDVIIKYLEITTSQAKDILAEFTHDKNGFQLL
ncbi:hypothetical protein LX97_01414 [Nonlabens dokdonensis]|uniref:Uncharacterized protein n=2 Tax=Nonlabens dokdonensis TaxID=328515 RepID=L7WA84_NONDD|nr:hypothetical protein [Nonlabens dokdonensis]AGC76756.1 hypothetical protein DDD_1629 [Nonlabens dokdonensis DSW-6]PZX44403.1 hypothetical protein LX97_01414 [Nonlabens dokdonensis]